MAEFDNLPDLVVVLILSFLSPTEQLFTANFVCKKWNLYMPNVTLKRRKLTLLISDAASQQNGIGPASLIRTSPHSMAYSERLLDDHDKLIDKKNCGRVEWDTAHTLNCKLLNPGTLRKLLPAYQNVTELSISMCHDDKSPRHLRYVAKILRSLAEKLQSFKFYYKGINLVDKPEAALLSDAIKGCTNLRVLLLHFAGNIPGLSLDLPLLFSRLEKFSYFSEMQYYNSLDYSLEMCSQNVVFPRQIAYGYLKPVGSSKKLEAMPFAFLQRFTHQAYFSIHIPLEVIFNKFTGLTRLELAPHLFEKPFRDVLQTISSLPSLSSLILCQLSSETFRLWNMKPLQTDLPVLQQLRMLKLSHPKLDSTDKSLKKLKIPKWAPNLQIFELELTTVNITEQLFGILDVDNQISTEELKTEIKYSSLLGSLGECTKLHTIVLEIKRAKNVPVELLEINATKWQYELASSDAVAAMVFNANRLISSS